MILEIRDRENQDIILRLEVGQLVGVNLRGRRMRYANLNGVNLHLANMHRSDLWGSDFRDADLRLADLSYANVGNADFSGAKLAGVNLDGARYNSRTLWPTGFNPLDWGARFEGEVTKDAPGVTESPADDARRRTEQILAMWRTRPQNI